MDGIRSHSSVPNYPEIQRCSNLGSEIKGIASDGLNLVGKALDEFIPGNTWSESDLEIDSPEYKNVKLMDAAAMLGYFIQTLEGEGYPWELYAPANRTGVLKHILPKKKKIGEKDALMRLSRGEPVIFQPKRVINVGISPPEIKGKDVTGAESKGKMDVKTGGKEVRGGQAVAIKNFGDLKFLYELYNPSIQVDPKSDSKVKVAARQIAYFTKGTMMTQYPWKMYKPQKLNKKIKNMALGALKMGAGGALLGLGFGALLSLPAMALGTITAGAIGLTTAAAVGGAMGGFKGAKDNRHGEEINAFESLARLKNNQDVHFQQKTRREVGLAIPFPINVKLGSLSFFSDHHKGSKLSNMDDLEIFHAVQEQIPNKNPNATLTMFDPDNPKEDPAKAEAMDTARKIGYFTQLLESEGYPWELYAPVERNRFTKKFLPARKKIGEKDAINRLMKGEEVIFKPKRIINIGFSPPEMKGKDVTGADSKGKMEVKTGGMEVANGEPISIKNVDDLKFLYELYNPDVQVDRNVAPAEKIAAKQLAYFTKGTMMTQYPWKMYRPLTKRSKLAHMAKGAIKSGTVGAGVGLGIASLLALALGSLTGGPVGLATGTGIGALIGLYKGGMGRRHGKEINVFDALDRVKKSDDVYFQQKEKKEIGLSIPFPINVQLGSLSFYTDHHTGSSIKGMDDLEVFHAIQNPKKTITPAPQAQLPAKE